MKSELTIEASKSLKKILNKDEAVGYKIINQIHYRLPLDPYPETEILQSSIVKNLEAEGLDIYRLKSRDYKGYRMFYMVSDESILILEIVERNKDTYNKTSRHYKRIKKSYIEFYNKLLGQ